MKPRLTVDAKYWLSNAIELAIHQQQEGIYRSCLNCDHFDEKKEGCKKYNMLRPPARVIAYGCPTWASKDEIPF